MVSGLILFAVLGLAVGSFLNLCIDRLPDDQSIVRPSSHCDVCGHKLGILDLVPVFSYLWLRGRCRYCQAHIPLRVPLVEAASALLFFVLYWQFHDSNVELAFSLLYACALVVIFVTDLEQQLILNKVTYPGMAMALAFSFFRTELGVWSAVLGGLTGLGIMLLLYLLFRGGMGMGDVKLMGFVGLAVGFWEPICVALMLGMVAGGIGALFILAVRSKGRKDVIPYGPFLVFGAFTSHMWGESIWQWYCDLLT